jgi:hypothetical protein
MVRPTPTTINCPVCRQPFSALLEQLIDVGLDPTAKERLLSGRVNLVTCPHCGYRGMVGTPLVYHDPDKKLAIIYVPMELNLQQTERERLIGDFTNALMRSLPEDAPKGYLLQPRSALTLQGLTEQVLEADGITPEMLDQERRKVEIINQLAEVNKEERDALLEDNQHLFDLTFLELLTAAAQGASQIGNERAALRLLNVREHLLETTEAGQTMKAQQEALMEASKELQALGESITRESFVDLLVQNSNNPLKIEALGTLGRTLLDYTTFQLLTQHITRAEGEEKSNLEWVRNRLLEINAEHEQQARAVIQRSADTLRVILQSGDVPTAVRNNLDRIDDTFLQVLQVNIEEARKAGNAEVSNRLKQIRDEVLRIIQASAPPEIRLINDLLSVETEEESLELLRNRRGELSEEVVNMMGDLAEQLRGGGNEPAAARLDLLRSEAEQLV